MRWGNVIWMGALLVCGCTEHTDTPVGTSSIEDSGRITATAELWNDNDTTRRPIVSLDGLFERVFVQPEQRMHFLFSLTNILPNDPVDIEAPHGGALGKDGRPLMWTPHSPSDRLELAFRVGPQRGGYSITLRQGNRVEVVDIYAGQEAPVGLTGPVRTFGPGGEQ